MRDRVSCQSFMGPTQYPNHKGIKCGCDGLSPSLRKSQLKHTTSHLQSLGKACQPVHSTTRPSQQKWGQSRVCQLGSSAVYLAASFPGLGAQHLHSPAPLSFLSNLPPLSTTCSKISEPIRLKASFFFFCHFIF